MKLKQISHLLPGEAVKSVSSFMITFLILFAFSFSCNSSGKEEKAEQQSGWKVVLRGKVNNPQQGQIYIQELKDNGGGTGWQDTITLKANNTFSKQLRLTEPGYYRINFYNKQVLNVIVNRSDIEVNVDGGNPQGFVEIKGSPDLELIKTVQGMQAAFNNSPEMEKLNQEFNNAVTQKNEARIAELQQQYQTLLSKENDKIAQLLEQNAPSLAVINLLQNNTLDKDKYFNTYLKVAEKMNNEWRNYSHAKAFIEMVNKMKQTAIGEVAPEIALPSPEGPVVKLSSLRGKYVLVDFWAKWCGPCRQENPNVVRVYNKYKDQEFTVFGVSLDRSREDWMQAIREDNLTWTHVSDLKFWQSEAAKTYNITAIPFSLLLDPEGKIIDKNLRGAALDRRLAEIFDAKK